MNPLEIRLMRARDLMTALDWAAVEGWNPGLEDAFSFATVDPDGLLMGFVDDEPVGSVTVVNYDTRFAFLGFYIVRPEYRGRGHGRALWQAGMAHAGARLVGLDGVVDQQDNYRKSGFVHAHRNLRFAGTSAGALAHGLVPLDRSLLNAVTALDREVFPAKRAGFLEAWITTRGHVALGYVEKGALKGFGVLRPCRSGAKVGPLVAPDRAIAEALFDGLVHRWGGGEVFLDVPETNPAAVAMARDRGMTPMFETARMYTGPAPGLALERIFGITTFELG